MYDNLNSLTDEQKRAMHRICSKIVNRKFEDDKIITLNAPAGTGKSTVIRRLSSYLSDGGITHKVTAFTGRACSQIAKEGLTNVCTTHSLFLDPVVDYDGNLVRWDKKKPIDVKQSVGEAIIVDEGSMLPHEMYSMMCNVPDITIILVGDDAQLPSIEPSTTQGFDAMNLENSESLNFTKNFRQESGSGIVDLCLHLRENNTIPRKKKPDVRMIPKKKVLSLPYHKEHSFDVVLCAMNKTRKKINGWVRESRGFENVIPEVGETVICKRNDIVNNTRINNGELYRIESVFEDDETSRFMLSSLDSSKRVQVRVLNTCWETENSPKKHKGLPVQQFAFGYAVTVHAAQGSQFDNVLFVDENVSFFLDQQRFRYTAVSRAAKLLTIAI